jgi:hypothetical protein
MPEGTSEMYALLVLIFALSISINLRLSMLGGGYKHSS